MLTPRGKRILFTLVSEYLATGEAVASGPLGRGHGIELSPATIRAVLAELENQGYLTKSHASAGRMPTEKGLRVFVDALLASAELPHEVRQTIEQRMATAEPGLDSMLRLTGRILAETTGAAAVVVSLPPPTWELREVRFLSLRSHEVLAVLVGRNGAVQNRVLRTEDPITPTDLERANNLIQSLLEGRTLPEVRAAVAQQLELDRAHLDPRLRVALTLGDRALASIEREVDILIEGQALLINRPEFCDIDLARSALRTLEDKERLLRLLDRTLAAPGLQVLIGSETEAADTDELSIVAAGFGAGTVAALGSTRMDYPCVVPAVRFTASLLSRMLGDKQRRES